VLGEHGSGLQIRMVTGQDTIYRWSRVRDFVQEGHGSEGLLLRCHGSQTQRRMVTGQRLHIGWSGDRHSIKNNQESRSSYKIVTGQGLEIGWSRFMDLA
jgi:hypothetical protein